MQFKQAQTFDIETVPTFENGILVLKGEVKVNGVTYQADELAGYLIAKMQRVN